MKNQLTRRLSPTLLKFAAVAAMPALLASFNIGCADNDRRVDDRRIGPTEDYSGRPLGVEPGYRPAEPVPAGSRDPIRLNDGPAVPGAPGSVATPPSAGTGDTNDRPQRPGTSPPGTYSEPRPGVPTAPPGPRSDIGQPTYRQPGYDSNGVIITGQGQTVVVPGQPQGNQPMDAGQAGSVDPSGRSINGSTGGAAAGGTTGDASPEIRQRASQNTRTPQDTADAGRASGRVNQPGGIIAPIPSLQPDGTPANQQGQTGQNSSDSIDAARAAAAQQRNERSNNTPSDNAQQNRSNNNSGNGGSSNNNGGQTNQGVSAPSGGQSAPSGGQGAPSGGGGASGGNTGGGGASGGSN